MAVYKKMFEPIKIGNVLLKNRTIFPPISTNFAGEDGCLTKRFIQHYVRRAQGGVALIIVENVCIDYPEGRHGAFEPRIDSGRFLPCWRELIDALEKYDVKVSIELTHPGYKDKTIEALTNEEIERLIGKYVNAAVIAKDAGFDMVELQGAHRLIINHFLSPLTNHRKDRWGKRTEFAVELRRRIANVCGWEFPVTIRAAVDDFQEGGIDLNEGKRIASVLAEAGYDMIQADVGLGPKEKRLEPMAYEEGWRSYLAEKIRPLPVPVAAVGVIRTPEIAEEILEKKADLIVLGRTLIADPDWVNKAKVGKEHLIRRCIGCSECIKARHDEDTAIRCGVNANVGNEEEITEADNKKIVAIVGCGPAGLEAARVSSLRGHTVYLFCKKFGGQLIIAAVPPGKRKIKWLVDYYKNTLNEIKNVNIHNGEFQKKDIESLNPDVVIIATGAKPFVPHWMQKNDAYIYSDVLSGKVSFENKRIVIGGGGLVGCETALFLADNNRVIIVEMLKEIAEGMETLTRGHLLRELKNKGVTILTEKKIIDINKGSIMIKDMNTYEEEEIACDFFIAAFGNKPYVPFHFEDRPCYVIGDAVSSGRIVDAVHQGYSVAIAIK